MRVNVFYKRGYKDGWRHLAYNALTKADVSYVQAKWNKDFNMGYITDLQIIVEE